MSNRQQGTAGLLVALSMILVFGQVGRAESGSTASQQYEKINAEVGNAFGFFIAEGMDEDGSVRPIILLDGVSASAKDQLALFRYSLRTGPEAWRNSAFCFALGTHPEVGAAMTEMFVEELGHPDPLNQAGPHFQVFNRWPGSQGQPTELTWSFVPDGVGGSELFSRMDFLFGGNRSLWINQFQRSFDRWEELTGMTYTRVTNGGNDWDDGAFWGASGNDTTRGDIRIRMISIDGGGGTLAFNSFPSDGDMSLDRSENWAGGGAQFRFLRNVIMHEHGHGLGLEHVCPTNSTKLMEPALSTSFDGATHDDTRAIQRQYGDIFEPDNSAAESTDLGIMVAGSPVSLGVAPPPVFGSNPPFMTTLSIDANGETDWFELEVTEDSLINVTATPIGTTYDDSPQACGNSFPFCCTGNNIDSQAVADLRIDIIASDGVTVLNTSDAAGAGEAEVLSNAPLTGGADTFFVRISESNNPGAQSQLYTLSIAVFGTDDDIAPPQPNPAAFITAPFPTGTTEVTMQAETASDATGPVEYRFEVTSAAIGGSTRDWDPDPQYTDDGLSPNLTYSYRVAARDQVDPPLGPNETAFSDSLNTTTFIETPTGIVFGDDCVTGGQPCALTADSIEMETTGTLSWLFVAESGVFFTSITPNPEEVGGNEGINEWARPSLFGQPGRDMAINLVPDTEYTFLVKARNRGEIETGFSPPGSIRTLAAAPAAPNLSNATANSIDLDPDRGTNPDTTDMAVQCTATNPFDPTWDGMWVDASGNPSAVEVYQSDVDWGVTTVLGLQNDTEYTFQVKARNQDLIETTLGPAASLTTSAPSDCSLLGDVNDDAVVDGDDIAGFTRAKLALPAVGGENQDCADYDTGTLEGDIAAFVDDLIN